VFKQRMFIGVEIDGLTLLFCFPFFLTREYDKLRMDPGGDEDKTTCWAGGNGSIAMAKALGGAEADERLGWDKSQSCFYIDRWACTLGSSGDVPGA
jgi:hypothetical protein